MSDADDRPVAADPPGSPAAGPATEFVSSWQQTETLTALRTLVEVAGRVRPVVAERAGLSQSELVTLEHLVARPMGPAEVARLLGVTSAASTGIVDRLTGRGHVERHPHAGDRRRTDLVITPSGREEILGHLIPMFRALGEMDSQLDDAEREVVLRYLERATEAFRSVL
ncbi:MarR family transcriptional regulator [Nocardioides mesophilus]|uniref:MarR family transcriptional regulator n=2 Tax=Nocardioides mesophilus TaxID=433659 RepID=A0A7G9RH53_9ACTN|nr:MarR family transcriptional regulator [Nocardioides mesophilus]